MSDDDVARLLRSDAPLVVIEAPAGCGKTFQGASYAKDVVGTLPRGRLLILAHTHAACGEFGQRTQSAGSKVEIKTVASLTAEIASAYHRVLGVPPRVETWAWKDGGRGFEEIARKCAELLTQHPMIAQALARRYPIIICDEHQDCTADQHAMLMALHRGGARLRIFGDPLQRIFTGKTLNEAKEDAARWKALKRDAAYAELDFPHRWSNGSPDLGAWILKARTALLNEQPIEIPAQLPGGLKIIIADNISSAPGQYQLSGHSRKAVDGVMFGAKQMMVLTTRNELVRSLAAFTNRRIGVWEGHTREALSKYVEVMTVGRGNPEALASGFVAFLGEVGVGFSMSSHGKRLLQEIRDGCSKATTGKPASIQAMAKLILAEPNHVGCERALSLLASFVERKEKGFEDIKIDHKAEFAEAMRLGSYATPEEGYAELARRRAHFRRSLPERVLSTIHKAKGLECANVMVMPCDKAFSDTYYSRCRLYVALSRATHTLTLVLPSSNGSALVKRR